MPWYVLVISFLSETLYFHQRQYREILDLWGEEEDARLSGWIDEARTTFEVVAEEDWVPWGGDLLLPTLSKRIADREYEEKRQREIEEERQRQVEAEASRARADEERLEELKAAQVVLYNRFAAKEISAQEFKIAYDALSHPNRNDGEDDENRNKRKDREDDEEVDGLRAVEGKVS
jgi:hypothetical protein